MRFEDFILGDLFFQVNTWRGYRYLDLAGVVMNAFEDRFKTMEVGVAGLSMADPVDPGDFIREIRVTSEQIWTHIRPRTPWTTVRHELPVVIDRIARTIEVQGYRRKGLRAYLLLPVSAERFRDRLTVVSGQSASWASLGTVTGFAAVAVLSYEQFKVRLQVRPARRVSTGSPAQADPVIEDQGGTHVEAESDLPAEVALFDVDFYDDRQTPDLDVKAHIGHSVRFFDERVTPFAERVLEGLIE